MTALSLVASSSRVTLPFLPQLSSIFRSALPRFTLSSPALASSALSAPWYLSIPGLASLLELLPPILLAVPKSKISHSRKSMRSANKGPRNKSSESSVIIDSMAIVLGESGTGADADIDFSQCEACGGVKLAHNICPSCYSQISRK